MSKKNIYLFSSNIYIWKASKALWPKGKKHRKKDEEVRIFFLERQLRIYINYIERGGEKEGDLAVALDFSGKSGFFKFAVSKK